MGSPCYCSACCQALGIKSDEAAWVYWMGSRVAAVYPHHVDFFNARRLTPALAEGGGAKPIEGSAPAHGVLRFLDAKGRLAEPSPTSSRAFSAEILSGARSSRRGRFLVCADADPGVVVSSAVESGFCGAFDVDGKEAFRLSAPAADGTARAPVGISDDGNEALFSLTKERGSGERVVAAYLLWRGGGIQSLPPDSPRIRALLRAYEGPLVLPSVETGKGGD